MDVTRLNLCAVFISILLLQVSCSSAPSYKIAKDALTDVLPNDESISVPEEAYDALTPNLDRDQLAPARFDVVAKNNAPKAFFMGLVDGMGINIVVHPDVKKRITLHLKNVTLLETLQAVRDIHGYQFETTSYGYRILPSALQNKVFQVNYLNVSRSGSSGMSVASGHISSNNSSASSAAGGSISTATKIETQANSDFWKNLQVSVKTIVGDKKGRRVVVDSQSGLVIVRAYPDELAAVEDFLNKAELSLQRQVIIEAKILEVTLSEGFQSGIQWDNFGLGPGGTFAASSNEIAGQLSSEIVRNADGLAGVFSLNFSTSNFNGVIELLQSQGEVQVLSSPRISTLNNQKAVIKVGTDEFFVTDVSTNTTTTTTTTNTSPEVSLTPFFSGIALDVTPQIGDNNEVILHVHPSVTEVVERNKVIEVGDSTFDLPLAYSSIREADSIIRARSGQVVVIGGLLQNKKTKNDASVPWLSRIPVLGYLFRQSRRSIVKSELIILLQPKIIEPSGWHTEIESIKGNFPRWK